ncbi:MAG: acyl-CoA dehydrogenase family protein [Bdellovibrionota bacterium]
MASFDTAAAQGLLSELEKLFGKAKNAVKAKVSKGGKPDAGLIDQNQIPAHGLAGLATELEAARQITEWAGRVGGDLEALMARAVLSQVARHFTAEVSLSQMERIPVSQIGLSDEDVSAFKKNPAVAAFLAKGDRPEDFAEIAKLIREKDGKTGNFGLDNEDLEMIRDQFKKMADEKVAPIAPDIHDNDKLVPIELIRELAELGVFGLTIPEEYGGSNLGKHAMCVVTEELSRGYIGVGSLATRTEIAGELIRLGGTDEQRKHFLPKLSAGDYIPTAVFTEPDNGSDLAHLKTRATREGDYYKINGQKTWITHAARANLMTVLARTNPKDDGYGGLSMFLVTKDMGTEARPFTLEGLQGDEIPVLGYRGMKEYALGFEDVRVPASALLGGVEGKGFKQLMTTFESARIQTAARAVGVGQAAFDLAYKYATERIQFGKPLIEFPRVWYKIAQMATWLMASRQITYFSARQKDLEKRCDLEAGMAKLLAAKVAWECADVGLQIHGGNGFATEYPISRVLVDSRVLSIFEGAAEIQAQVIARRLLEE